MSRKLTRWYVSRHQATPARGAYAYVQLHGEEYRWWWPGLRRFLVSETCTNDLPQHPPVSKKFLSDPSDKKLVS